MTFDIVLDVAIGLVLVFALFSLLTSTIVELISAMLRRRGRMLEYGIAQILDDRRKLPRSWPGSWVGGNAFVTLRGAPKSSLTEQFFELEPIKVLMDGNRLPTYISTDAFVTGVMSLIHKELGVTSPDTDYGAAARATDSKSRLVKLIRELFPEQVVTRQMLEKRLRVYYEDANDRITGWYGRETQLWLMGIGFLVAAMFNVNTVYIASELATNANLREQYVVMASSAEIAALGAKVEADAAAAEGSGSAGISENSVREKSEQIDEINKHISKLTLPIGRCRGFVENDRNSSAAPLESGEGASADDDFSIDTSGLRRSCIKPGNSWAYGSNLFVEVIGWAITAFAISLGAPFWFDLLSKLVAIRRAGKLKKQDKDKGEDEESPGSVTSPSAAGDAAADAGAALAPNEFERDSLSKDDIKTIQRLLGVSEATGNVASPATRQAIKAWKSARSLSSPDGYLDKHVVLRLFKEGGVTA